MVIWRDVTRGILKAFLLSTLIASVPTIIIPAIITLLVLKLSESNIESFLAIIIFVQLYIIWAQFDVARRQTLLSVMEFDPEFKIEVEEKTPDNVIAMGEESIIGNTYNAKLKNVGKLLVENARIAVTTEPKNPKTLLNPFVALQFKFQNHIAPYEKVDICTFEKDVFNNSKITININYAIIFGVHSKITFVKEPVTQKFELSEFMRITMPRISLLNSFEKLLSNLRLLTSFWRFASSIIKQR